MRVKDLVTNPGHKDGARKQEGPLPKQILMASPIWGEMGLGVAGLESRRTPLGNAGPQEGRAILTTEDRSTFSTLLSCSSTGWRPATRSCTEDVRYTKLSSQSPLRAEGRGGRQPREPQLAPESLEGLPLRATRAPATRGGTRGGRLLGGAARFVRAGPHRRQQCPACSGGVRAG